MLYFQLEKSLNTGTLILEVLYTMWILNVSEQNLLLDKSGEPVKHPLIEEIFSGKKGCAYFKLSN